MAPPKPIPSCGRKVHVREFSGGRQVGDVLPADVIRISRPQQDGVENPDILDLTVFGEESAAAVNRKAVPYDDGTIASGHAWSWPPMPAPAEAKPPPAKSKSPPPPAETKPPEAEPAGEPSKS